MGEKAAKSEVINRLVSALGDEYTDVRSSACEALGKMGEKAARTEVINRLVSALGDEDDDVRSSACMALSAMGENAATIEVINRLLSALQRFSVESTVDSTITMLNVLELLGDTAAHREKEFSSAVAVDPGKSYTQSRSLGSHILLKTYMDTADHLWLPVVVWAFRINGSAVTVIENTIWVYDREEIVKIPLTNQESLDKLQKAFVDM
jgi:hypothetical protein